MYRYTLSRAPTAEPGPTSVVFQNELEAFIDAIISSLPASSNRLQEYCDKQKADPVCSLIRSYCTSGWPDTAHVPPNLSVSWSDIFGHQTEELARDLHFWMP